MPSVNEFSTLPEAQFSSPGLALSKLSVLNSAVLSTSQYFLEDIPFQRGKDKEDVPYTHKMKYYSAKKKDQPMPFKATWMNLEIIKLNKSK